MNAPANPNERLALARVTADRREEFIARRECAPPPFGCGKPWGEFRDALSEKEACKSGLCQECQDNFFDSKYKAFAHDADGKIVGSNVRIEPSDLGPDYDYRVDPDDPDGRMVLYKDGVKQCDCDVCQCFGEGSCKSDYDPESI